MTDNLYAPWRLEYVKRERDDGCPFCDLSSPLWVAREALAGAILNRFPYANGHTLIVPMRHISSPEELSEDEVLAMHGLRQRVLRVLRDWIRPQGFNLGTNLGDAAGAGIAAHLHDHIVPRWQGDVNFMPVLADIKIIPQLLEQTAAELKERLDEDRQK